MQTTYSEIKTKVTELSEEIKAYPYEERYTQLVNDMSSKLQVWGKFIVYDKIPLKCKSRVCEVWGYFLFFFGYRNARKRLTVGL